jgi:RHS repeat-associated protein
MRWKELLRSILALGSLLLLGALYLSGTAQAAECTDEWIGSAPGSWEAAGNWSAEHAPTSSDVACVPSGAVVEVSTGSYEVDVLQGDGELRILSGSLAMRSESESSNIAILHLSGGAVRGSGQLFVTKTFTADGGATESEGETVIGSKAEGRIEPIEAEGPGLRVAQKSSLVVKGSLVVAGVEGKLNVIEGSLFEIENGGSLVVGGPEGRLTVKESADFVNSASVTTNAPSGQTNLIEHASLLNEGSYVLTAPEGGLVATGDASIENSSSLKIEGSAGEIRLEETTLINTKALRIEAAKGRLRGSKGSRVENSGTLAVNGEGEGNGLIAGTGATPILFNEGTVRKDEGSGMAFVEFKTNNESLVKAESGNLTFEGGGGSGAEQEDKWVAEGEEAELNFSGALFTLGDLSEMRGPIYLLKSAIVKGHKINGGQAEVSIPSGKLKVTGAGERSSFEGLALAVGEINLFKNAMLETGETFIGGGLLNLGEGGEGDLGSFFQSGGRTISRHDATVTSSGVYVEHGHFTTGTDSLFEFGSYTQAPSSSVAVEPGGRMAGSAASMLGGSLELRAGTESAIGGFFQEHGTVNLRREAGLGINSVFLGAGGGLFETGTASTLGTASLYEEGITTNIGSSGLVTSASATIDRGVLKGSGTLIADNLSLGDAKLSGSGSTIVSETGSVYAETSADLEHRRLVTNGEFSLGGSTLVMGHGARLENKGEFDASSEASGGAQIRVAGGSGTNPRIINRAAFEKNSGAGTTTITVPFENTGRVHQFSGVLDIENRVGVPHSEKFGQRCNCKDPVEAASGDFSETQSDFAIGGRGFGLDLSRSYGAIAAATATAPGLFGYGWSNDFSDHIQFEEEEVVVEVEVEGEEPGEGEEETEEGEEEWEEIEAEGESEEEWEEIEAEEEQEWEEAEEEEWEEHVETVKRITVVTSTGSTIRFTEDATGDLEPPEWSQSTLSGDAESGYTYVEADLTEYRFSPGGALQSVTDRNGNETTLAYDEAGQLEQITDPAGRSITFSYNPEGFVESAEDPMGHVVHYVYEGGDLTSVTMPGDESPRWRFGYDGSHRMTSMIDGRGGETTNEYDEYDRVVSQTDPAGRTTAFEYDGFHTRITNENSEAVTDIWFNSDNEPSSITDGFGTEEETTETFSYDEAGHLLSQTDGNGHTTSYTYNPAGDRTSMTDADENETSWEYNGTHDVISETTPNGETTTIKRDPSGNPEAISRPTPAEATQTTSFEYEPYGQLKALTNPLEQTWTYGYDSQGDRKSETDPEGRTRTWAYNEDSQLIASVSPRGYEEGAEASEFTTTIERDPQGRPEAIIDPLEHTTEYAYDPNGNVESETDAKGHTTAFTYNPDDQPIKTERPSGAALKTEYDGAGAVVAQIDGNEHATTYVRNILGQPVETIDPLGRTTTREFDPAGNLTAVIDPAERVTSYGYDPANRIREISYSEEATPGVSFEYDPDGNLIAMSDGSGESTFAYDQLDQLEEATDGHGDSVAYAYDLAGELERLVYPNGKGIDQSFDKAGHLEGVTDWLGHATSFGYDADSNVEAISFPAASGNLDEFGYDRSDRMTTAEMRKGPESLAALAYSRDQLGQLEGMAEEGLPGEAEQSYEYDEDNRLIEAGSASYEYDPADNPIKTPGSINAFDEASQLETGTAVGYEYDSLGERVKATPTEGAATTYSYDQAGHLTAVKRAKEGESPGIYEAFAYDGAGLLASRTAGESTKHLTWGLSGGLPLLLSDSQASYIYGPGGLPIEQIDAEETPTYYHHDQLGSTRMLTDPAGEPTATFTYDAYGGLEESAGSQTTPLGYAGQYTLSQSGLQYLRARVYDPVTGQFLTRDPIEELTRQPYGYVFDNPLNGADPSGQVGEGVAACAATWEVPAVGEASCGAGVVEVAAGIAALVGSVLTAEQRAELEHQLTLTQAEEEYEEEHHECKVEEERRAERGVPSDTRTKDQQFADKLSHPNDPNNPRGGSVWIRIVALIARLFHHQ